VPLLGAHPRHWVRAAHEVAGALVYLHERAVVHRDIKARNILFDESGSVRLIDFALAADESGPIPRGGGTAAYARAGPGQNGAPDAADDVHAFAVLLYELLAGQLPFGVDPARETLKSAPPPLACGNGGIDEGAKRLVDIVQNSLGPGGQSASGDARVFLDALELTLSRYL